MPTSILPIATPAERDATPTMGAVAVAPEETFARVAGKSSHRKTAVAIGSLASTATVELAAPEYIMAPESEDGSIGHAAPSVNIDHFSSLYEQFLPRVIGFMSTRVSNPQLASDLAQDTFLKIFQAFASGTTVQSGAIEGWIFRIASNTATDTLRRQRLITWLPLSLFNDKSSIGAGVPSEDDTIRGHQISIGRDDVNSVRESTFQLNGDNTLEERIGGDEIVQAVISKLPPHLRDCFILREFGGYAYSEIAQVLDITLPALKTRLARARKEAMKAYWLATEGDGFMPAEPQKDPARQVRAMLARYNAAIMSGKIASPIGQTIKSLRLDA